MKLKIKQHKKSLVSQSLPITDKTFIHRYDKPIRSWSYMESLIKKI